MESIVYNVMNNNVLLSEVSNSIRVQYFFMKKVSVTGDLSLSVSLDEGFSNLSLLNKIKMVKDFYSLIKPDSDLDALTGIEAMAKKQATIKHPDTKSMLVFRKMERLITAMAMHYKELFKKYSEVNGMLELKELNDFDILGFIPTDTVEDIHIKGNKNMIKASNLLQFVFPENVIETIFLMTVTGSFIQRMIMESIIIYDISDTEAMDAENTYLIRCLSIPIPEKLKAVELKAIRSKVIVAASAFNIKADSWIEMFNTNETVPARINYLKEDLLPTFSLIQKRIDENDILNFTKELSHNNSSMEIWIGELPIPVLWQYFFKSEIINETVHNKLQDALSNRPELKKRIPVMVFSTNGLVAEKANTLQEIVASSEFNGSKKSILINE